MSQTVGDLPFFPLAFDKKGKADPAHEQALLAAIASEGFTDLFVVSHGWLNDAANALALYEELFTNASTLLRGGRAGARKTAVAGVFWPSKPNYKDFGTLSAGSGGAASAANNGAVPQLRARLEDFRSLFEDDVERAEMDGRIDAAIAEVDRLDDSPQARRRFIDALRATLSVDAAQDEEDASDAFMSKDGDDLLQRLSAPDMAPPPKTSGQGALSVGAGAGGALGAGGGGLGAAANRAVDLASYYEMKARAGVVGAKGLAPILHRVRSARPDLEIHMVGHSFGARLVTAAVDAGVFKPASLALLQAAFSHNAFSPDYGGGKKGFFRKVVEGRVDGPVVITHTKNDQAVGRAYPLASRLLRQQASALGDRNDLYGGLGRNGAVKMPAAELQEAAMKDETGAYAFVKGKVHNLLADDYIRKPPEDAHGDVSNIAVANVVLSAAGY